MNNALNQFDRTADTKEEHGFYIAEQRVESRGKLEKYTVKTRNVSTVRLERDGHEAHIEVSLERFGKRNEYRSGYVALTTEDAIAFAAALLETPESLIWEAYYRRAGG